MGFREFINNRGCRRSLEADFKRYQNIKPPANPSTRYIGRLVRRLLDERKASDARRELGMIGAAAVPALAAALRDPRFHRARWKDFSHAPTPLESVLDLLVPDGAEHILAAATALVGSPSEDVRKTIALHLASLGRAEMLPTLAGLLGDADGYVRSYVCIGMVRAAQSGRASEEFRAGAYDLLLPQCDQRWGSATNDVAEAVVTLDPARAAIDFASGRWLHADNPNVHRILEASNEAGILLPEALLRTLLDHALPSAVGPKCYPHEYVAAAALEALVLRLGESARPLLRDALSHEQDQIRRAAARGLVRLAGLEDPVDFACERVQLVGFAGLTRPQRVAFCAFQFDAEVCNGGIMQFFANTSGAYAAETLDALRELDHAEAQAALAEAMRLIGPPSRETDRDLRLDAFEGRYDQLQAAFGPLEKAYYASKDSLRRKILLYAIEHPEHFRK